MKLTHHDAMIPYTRVKVDGTVTMYWVYISPVLTSLMGTVQCTLTMGGLGLHNVLFHFFKRIQVTMMLRPLCTCLQAGIRGAEVLLMGALVKLVAYMASNCLDMLRTYIYPVRKRCTIYNMHK